MDHLGCGTGRHWVRTPATTALFRLPVGAPPRHLAFFGRYAYLTSGYGSTIETVDAATGRVFTRTATPYGSFELAAADGYVATASLLRGTLAIYSPDLKLLHVVELAPATRRSGETCARRRAAPPLLLLALVLLALAACGGTDPSRSVKGVGLRPAATEPRLPPTEPSPL